MPFESLGLSPQLLAGVDALGYTAPTPIQTQAIPEVLAGRDVVGVAQTGTGKTAAFVLPMLQLTPKRQGVQALVVTPTRELALQIAQVVKGASRSTRHRCAVVFGGVGLQPQIDTLRRGVDIVIACPGRLLDLHERGVVDLSHVSTLVLDEADRMLDMGFWPDVRRILRLLPEQRQNLLFSATMDKEVTKIVDQILTDPARIEVSPPSTPVDRIAQSLYPVARSQKTDLLVELLQGQVHARTLVFTRTKHRADRVARQLDRAGVSTAAIHGGRSQSQRQTALEAFKRGKHRVLVATDVVSRGIDVDEISHVVNYDMPNSAEDYVHRIGRTARAGASGAAISFIDPEEFDVLHDIEKALGAPLACEDVDGFIYAERVVPDPDRVPGVRAKHIGTAPAKRKSGGRSGGGQRRAVPNAQPKAGQQTQAKSGSTQARSSDGTSSSRPPQRRRRRGNAGGRGSSGTSGN